MIKGQLRGGMKKAPQEARRVLTPKCRSDPGAGQEEERRVAWKSDTAMSLDESLAGPVGSP